MKAFAVAIAGGTLLLSTLPSSATLARAWVSGHGTDQAGCGPVATPCRTLQYVHDTIINAGGEIDVLDSAGYGSLSITKALSVVNDGNVAGVLASGSGNGIAIAAGANDAVVLRGLTVEGGGTGTDGIHFTSGATLLVENCSVSDFAGSGIAFLPTTSAELQVAATSIRNSIGAAAYVAPNLQSAATVRAAFDRVTTFSNGNGFFIEGRNIVSAATLRTSISNSSTTYNIFRNNNLFGQGIVAAAMSNGGTVTVVVGGTTVANSNLGLNRTPVSQAQISIGRSILTGNSTAIAASGIVSFGDNFVAGNTSNGSAFTTGTPQ